MATEISTPHYGGTINVIAKYLLSFMQHEDPAHPRSPENSMGEGAAGEELFRWLRWQGASQETGNAISAGFEVGIRCAELISRKPLDCGPEFEDIIEEFLSYEYVTGKRATS